MCETTPKVHCSHCLLYLNQGDNPEEFFFNRLRLDALSIPNYVIKKGATHGPRHGKTEEQTEYHMTWNVWKRCCKKVDSQGEHFTDFHHRFLRDPVYRESQLAIGWMDEFTYHLTPEEEKKCQGQWYLTLDESCKNGPMKLRYDFRAVVIMKNRSHLESREPIEEPIRPGQQRRTRRGQEIFSKDYLSIVRVDQHTGWQYWLPTSSSSWWHESE